MFGETIVSSTEEAHQIPGCIKESGGSPSGMGFFSCGDKKNKRLFEQYWRVFEVSELSLGEGCLCIGHVSDFPEVNWSDLGDMRILVRYGRIYLCGNESAPHQCIIDAVHDLLNSCFSEAPGSELYACSGGTFDVENVYECHHRWEKHVDFSIERQADAIEQIGAGEVAVFNESLIELTVELATLFHSSGSLGFCYGIRFEFPRRPRIRVMLFKRPESNDEASSFPTARHSDSKGRLSCYGGKEKREITAQILEGKLGSFFNMKLISSEIFYEGEAIRVPVPFAWASTLSSDKGEFFYQTLPIAICSMIFRKYHEHRARLLQNRKKGLRKRAPETK